MIDCFYQDPDRGDLFVTNGIDEVMRWDGLSDQFESVGLDAPTAAVTLAGSLTGQIVGTYWAYERFLDAQGNVSNLSPISAEFTAQGSTRTVSDVSSATPIVVTSSSAHGLNTGDWVKITGVGGVTEANNTWQITVTSATEFSLDDSTADGITTYNGGGSWISGVGRINYTGVQVPSESKVVRRQILRNTDGQATTLYVDVDSEDMSATSFSSTLIDSLLQAGESVPLLDDIGNLFANAHDKPPTYFKCICQQLDRMFLAGLLEYNRGSCSVTNGSPTVTGAGTDWKSTMAGRYLYVDGGSKTYEIDSVNETNQTLTLTDNYDDVTSPFAFYSIKVPPAYRRVVQFTQAGQPQSWPPFNAFSLQETGDEITALFQMGPYLYIAEKAHIHKFTFSVNPLTDGTAFMVGNRGAVNQRCIVVVDNTAFMLDELGVHKFTGNSQVESASEGIQSIFRTDESFKLRINWHWKEYFHASLDRQRETIRWFVCLDGNRYTRHSLCYQYRQQRWWVEEYPLPIGGTCAGYLGGFTGTPQAYYGAQHAKVLASWTNTVDLVDPTAGTIRSTATSASAFTISDSLSSWSGIINAPISIIHGTGKGQVRRIISASGTSLVIDSPWAVIPDSTSQYQIGGVEWTYRSAWFRFTPTEKLMPNRFELIFEPLASATTADLKFFYGFSGSPERQAVTQASRDGNGVESTKGLPDLVVDLTREDGLVDRQFPYNKDFFIRGRRYSQFELSGVSNQSQVKLYQMIYEGFLSTDGGGP